MKFFLQKRFYLQLLWTAVLFECSGPCDFLQYLMFCINAVDEGSTNCTNYQKVTKFRSRVLMGAKFKCEHFY